MVVAQCAGSGERGEVGGYRLECHPLGSGEPWKVFKWGHGVIPFINDKVL